MNQPVQKKQNINKAWWEAKLGVEFGLSKEKTKKLLDIFQEVLKEEIQQAKEEERERIKTEVEKWKIFIGSNFYHPMAAKQLYELIASLSQGQKEKKE